MKNIKSFLPVLLVTVSGYASNADAAKTSEHTNPNTAHFSDYTWNSRVQLAYPDLDAFYAQLVIDNGLSDRERVPWLKAKNGTRMKDNIKRLSAFEANRFYFEAFQNEANRPLVRKLRESLEAVPEKVPLASLNRKEQLAYWLNLHNIAVLEKLVSIYPEKNLRDELSGPHSFLNEPFIRVLGLNLSPNDIRYKIVLPHYKDKPNVIYGFYFGNIGGPSIRPSAFRGGSVYTALEENAFEFINSNRGTQARRTYLAVSTYYLDYPELFGGEIEELNKHLALYADDEVARALSGELELEANLEDWHISDVYGTMRKYGAGLAHNPAALAGAGNIKNGAGGFKVSPVEDPRGLSPVQREILQKLHFSLDQAKGSVTIKDLAAKQPDSQIH